MRIIPCIRGQKFRKAFYSFLIALGISISSVAGTQAVGKALTNRDDLAFLITYVTTLFNIVIFPAYLLVNRIFSKEPDTIKNILKDCVQHIDRKESTGTTNNLRVFGVLFGFTCLWILANYTYIKSLAYLKITDIAALFSTSNIFVFIFSLIILKELFYLTKFFSVLMSVVGVFLYFYSENFQFNKTIGITLVLAAAIFSALYKVIYKVVIKNGKIVHVLFTLTVIGVINAFVCWIFLIILHFTKLEIIPPVSSIPWLLLSLRGIFALIMNLLINFGIAYSSSIVVSIGALLSIPLNAIIDITLNGYTPSALKGIASIIIVLSFILIILPEGLVIKLEPFWNRTIDDGEKPVEP